MPDLCVGTQPQASSGLGGYLAAAFARRGCGLQLVDARSLPLPKIWPTITSFSLSRESWWRRRWEKGLYSISAWERNTRLNGRLLDRRLKPDMKILQVGKEYFPHPQFARMEYYVFLLYNMRLSLADGVTPWVPPPKDREGFLDLETRLYRHARHIFVGGAYVKASLVADYGVDAAQVTTVGGGVHEYFLQHQPEAPPPVTKKCLFVGWDFGMKGGADAVRGFAAARAEIPDLEFIIAGPAPAEVPSGPGIRAIGPVAGRPPLLELYRQADLFIMPSLRDSFGFVFLEAMSQGLPCIGSRMNAMPEIIEDGLTGYLVPPRDANAIAAAIVKFFSQPENKRVMGARAMQRVRERFTWDRVAERMAAIMFQTQ